jgi:transposase-like protein
MHGRDFKAEVKTHCCRLVENDGMKVSEVCKQYDLDRQTLHRWLGTYRELGDEAFTDKSLVTKSSLLKKQQREIERLREENEILKKAIAYSSQRKNG